MDDIATRHLALQQAVIAAGAFANDHSVVLELARHFAAFLYPRENLAPQTPAQNWVNAQEAISRAKGKLPSEVFMSEEEMSAMLGRRV